ncbi:hypothetical protein EH223_03025 [candidate division KSB1 bacterium]|nr:hypothetical protein [candidate division KSB1 bacterium]RQW06114.1 MAG: hypothetical protein EH223_03025 [candidate division KSB1 bacterium]
MKQSKYIMVLFFSAFMVLLACSSNKLVEYDLREADIAARTFMPPRANVFTDLNVNFNPHDIVGTAISVGSTVARENEAIKARARLDSAMQMVDVPAIIEEEVLFRAAEMLNFRPVNEVKAADFVFNMRMEKYGIDAKGWDAGTFFVIESKVELIDNQLQRRIWKRSVTAREPLSPRVFGISTPIENVMDAVALSQLSVDEMAAGMEFLANFSAEIIAEKLYRDYIKSRD